jgi:CheY-specific phosphatase CheX
LAFHGRPSGSLTISLSLQAARLLAAGFLGEDEEALDHSQPGEVVCELANMLCGSLLSQMWSEETFDLAAPQLIPAGRGTGLDTEPPPAASRSFAIENGILTATLHLEAAA